MAAADGSKTGGRQKGTPNKATSDVLQKLAEIGCDPILGMARIAMGDVPCPICSASGRAHFLIVDGDITAVAADREGATEMTCIRCLGKGLDPIPQDLRFKAFSELAPYVAPKRKPVDGDGNDQDTGVVVQIVRLSEVKAED